MRKTLFQIKYSLFLSLYVNKDLLSNHNRRRALDGVVLLYKQHYFSSQSETFASIRTVQNHWKSLPNFFIFLNYFLAQNLSSIPAFVTQNLYHNLYVHCPWYNICLVRHQETVFALEVVNSGFKFSSATENQYRTLPRQ